MVGEWGILALSPLCSSFREGAEVPGAPWLFALAQQLHCGAGPSSKSALGGRMDTAVFWLGALEICSPGSKPKMPQPAGEPGGFLETPIYLSPAPGQILLKPSPQHWYPPKPCICVYCVYKAFCLFRFDFLTEDCH